MREQSRWAPVQDPIIRQQSNVEAILQGVLMAGTTSLAYWLFGFEVSLLVVLVLGFTLTTMNITAGATSTNVQIAEVRDLLQRMSKGNVK